MYSDASGIYENAKHIGSKIGVVFCNSKFQNILEVQMTFNAITNIEVAEALAAEIGYYYYLMLFRTEYPKLAHFTDCIFIHDPKHRQNKKHKKHLVDVLPYIQKIKPIIKKTQGGSNRAHIVARRGKMLDQTVSENV